MKTVKIAVEGGEFLYKVGENLKGKIKIGHLVEVELKGRRVKGWVVEEGKVGKRELKPVKKLLSSHPLLDEEFIKLGKIVANYYQELWYSVLTFMIPTLPEIKMKEILSPIKGTKKFSPPPVGMVEAIKGEKYQSVIIHGDERLGIYFRIIEGALNLGRGVLFLSPEIKEAIEYGAIFREKFGNIVGILHSGLRKEEMWYEWMRIKKGKTKIVVGVKVGVFAPVKELGVIIVDKEGDSNYKNKRKPKFWTPTVGEMRAKLERCLYVKGAKFPLIESVYKVKKENGKVLKVVKKRKTKIYVVDMRRELGRIFSKLLKRKIEEYLKKERQIILFLNRRGYSSFILCEDCGYIPICSTCNISLRYHKSSLSLKCHYCGYEEKGFSYCPKCRGVNLSYKGIGTARVEERFRELFPKVNIFRLDLDTISPKYLSHFFSLFKEKEFQVLLGTQFLIKPVKFPIKVGLVGIILADVGMNLPNFRTKEYTLSLLMELREMCEEMVIQTYSPQAEWTKGVVDYEKFYQTELYLRKKFNYPPYSSLILITVEAITSSSLSNRVNKVKQFLQRKRLNFLGPVELPSRKGKFKSQILVKVKTMPNLRKILQEGIKVEVDPIYFE